MKKVVQLLLVILVVSFVGCGKKAAKEENKLPKIAVISKGYQHEFWRTVEKGTEDAGSEFGAEVSFIGPEKESEIGKQVGMVENAINKNVDAIVLAALDAEALKPVVKRAVDRGITVVTFDSNVAGDLSSSFVATDNVAAGAIAGENMAKLIGEEGKVAIVAHNPGTTTAIDREKGFRDAISKYPNIKVLNTQFSGGDKSRALSITQDIITANPDIKGVYGTNEGSSVGVARGIEEKGLGGKIVVVGFDSSQDEINLLEKDVITGMVVQRPYDMGYLSVKTALEVLEGKEVSNRIDTGAIYVTKENMNTEEAQKILYPFGK